LETNARGLKITQQSQNTCSKIQGRVFSEVAEAPQATATQPQGGWGGSAHAIALHFTLSSKGSGSGTADSQLNSERKPDAQAEAYATETNHQESAHPKNTIK